MWMIVVRIYICLFCLISMFRKYCGNGMLIIFDVYVKIFIGIGMNLLSIRKVNIVYGDLVILVCIIVMLFLMFDSMFNVVNIGLSVLKV